MQAIERIPCRADKVRDMISLLRLRLIVIIEYGTPRRRDHRELGRENEAWKTAHVGGSLYMT